jgi:hypothetical protein
MKKNLLAISFLLAAAPLCAGLAHAGEEDVSKANPGRWYQPDDTPKERYQNLVKEANAAHGEALQGCKELRGKQARSCRGEAKAAQKEDMDRAKRIYQDYKGSASPS